jgi:hypothetical protein
MLRRSLAVTAILAGFGALVIGTAAAPGDTGSAAPKKITPSGVGKVKLGKTFRELREERLVGKLRRGCPLGGPNTRSARLRSPLRGWVDFTQTKPRTVTNISIRRGARARGVGVGDTSADIKAAFPKAKFDHDTEEVFGITLVKIPKNGGGRMQFAVDVDTKKITLIGVPFIAFCE